MKTLLKYRKDYYSQNGEDEVIEEILRRMGIKRKKVEDMLADVKKQ
jgi:hypothetical protein